MITVVAMVAMVVVCCWVLPLDLISAGDNNSSEFNKGMAYLLIKDQTLAQRFFKLHFTQNPNPYLENGYRLLAEGQYQEATRQFSDFLEISPRSTHALVGIALSTSPMAVSSTLELLKRALWLDAGCSAAYLCQGVEYVKNKNYPLAEQNYKQAFTIANVPEYKILLGRLYLEMNKPDAVLALVKEDADRVPDHFYFNFLVAQAYFQLDQLSELGRYSQAALDAQPGNNDVRLLMANYYLNMDEPHKANLILKTMKFEDYNEDYMKSYGHALVLLKDKKARDYLYEVFARKKWDKDINRLLGLYHLWMGDKEIVQNWIYRAILSGTAINRLKEIFPGEYKYPEYKNMPFFDVKQVAWVNENTILIAASRESGESEKIFVLNPQKMQVIQTLSFNGKFQEIFVSENREYFILCTTAQENPGVYLYALCARDLSTRDIQLPPVCDQPLEMSSVLVGFDHNGTHAYITDYKIEKLAFESPFSQVAQFGKKKPVYPVYPFSIYKYSFASKNLTRLNGVESVEAAPPIDAIKKYALVSNAISINSEVQALVEKGQGMDLTSSDLVKIYFPADTTTSLTHFIIYISDLKNAFHGLVWDQFKNKVTPIDETVFLGKGKYSELTIVDFNPEQKEILVVAKNINDLILYNYETHASIRLTKNAFNVHYNRSNRIAYVLSERSNGVFSTGSGLHVVSLSPYIDKSVVTKKNLTDVISCENESNVSFTTMDGEIVKMDDEYHFSYIGPDMDGCVYAVSPSSKKTAAYINGKLWLIE